MDENRPHAEAIRDAAIRVLRREVPDLHDRVFRHRTLPLAAEDLPCAAVFRLGTDGKGRGPSGPPRFAMTLSLGIRLRASGATEAEAEDAAQFLADAAEAALLEDPDFVAMVEDIPRVAQTLQVQAGGGLPVADVGLTIELTWRETRHPRLSDRLARAHVRVDAIDPADPAGTYPPAPPFPAPFPAPRPHGPDGRAEGGFDLDFPAP